MIRYTLRCAQGHEFDSWFASSSTYDKLVSAGQVSCAICGDADVKKTLMAPRVSPSDAKAAPPRPERPDAPKPESVPATAEPAPMLSAPSSPLEAAIRALRKQVESNADNVGRDFPRLAREMHQGETDSRAIYGEASREEAVELMEDGVPVAPLPWTSRRND